MLSNLWETLLDFLFPPHCPRCGAYEERRGGWCPACLQQTALWRQLALPSQSPLTAAWAVGHYRGGLRDLIRGLKYHGRRASLPYIRSVLATVPAGWFGRLTGTAAAASWLAVPVPLFPAKERQRGFNQTELMFRDWLAAQGIPLARLLVRTRATRPQFGLDRAARRANLRGAFALAPDAAAALAGRDVLLLDDIYTTGTTADTCAACLLTGGARRVVLLALASDHAPY